MPEQSELPKQEAVPSQDTVHPWPLNVIEREWPRVKGAPWSFCLIGLVFIIIGGGAMFLLYSTFIIPGKDGTIELLRQELDAKPIPSTTPDAGIPVDQTPEFKSLKAEFENLRAHSMVTESYVDPNEWPPLTGDQIKEWSKVLMQNKVRSIEFSSTSYDDDDALIRSIESLVKKINVSVSIQEGSSGDPNYIYMRASEVDLAVPAVQKLFEEFGKPVHKELWGVNQNPPFGCFYISLGEKQVSTSP